MAKRVNFRVVAYQTRFEIMTAIKLPTPEVFQNLGDVEKVDLYREIFNMYHDVANFLASNLDVDDLIARYCED